MNRCCAVFVLLLGAPGVGLMGQTEGNIGGRVTDGATGEPVVGAIIEIDDRGARGLTDSTGVFLIRSVRPGRHRIGISAIGYRSVSRDSVLVESGRTVRLDVSLTRVAVPVRGVVVEAEPDPLLDPLVTQTVQRIRVEELRELPVSTLSEVVAIQGGVVGGSFRGGRVGQDVLIVDGLGLKNQFDAASGRFGLRIPAVAIQEASVITNAFSARYGRAVSGVVTAVTKEGGDRLTGHMAVETDRPFPDGSDVGLDRLVALAGGPLFGSVRFLAAMDAQARIDDDPVNAPPPADSLDPRFERPWLLPNAAGERYDLLGKLTIPLGARQTLRVLGVVSESRRELFDPVLKYTTLPGNGEEVGGRLAMLHLERTSVPRSDHTLVIDARLGFFESEAARAPVVRHPRRRVGAFSFSGLEFAGMTIAKSQDTVRARDPIPGFTVPTFADATPWGVNAFFMTSSPRGELRWNRFREVRGRVDVLLGRGRVTDVRVGGEYARQWVDTFTRLAGFRAVDDGAPPATAASYGPSHAAGYVEWQQRASDLTVSAGLRVDAFGSGVADADGASGKLAASPRLAVSTALGSATVVASVGRFVQPPDLQYLVSAAFDDTLRTGRFRRGNPSLGFETSTQYELQARVRPSADIGFRAGVYVRRLEGLIASVPVGFDPDSAVFANGDFGTVKGVEIALEREYRDGFALRATYVLQQAQATATDARDLFRRLRISPTGDTIRPSETAFPLDFDRRHALSVTARARVPSRGGAVFAGTEAGAVVQWSSGLPFSLRDATGDSLIGLPNSQRLPSQFTVNVMLRRSIDIGATAVGVYLDVRNLTNRRNVVAVRRSSGQPDPTDAEIAGLVADAFEADPTPIPYESPRYRAWADADGDGLIAGMDELGPMYERAARDFTQPIFAYGIPRLLRFGVEIAF